LSVKSIFLRRNRLNVSLYGKDYGLQ